MGTPGQVDGPGLGAVVAAHHRAADAGWAAVVAGGLDEQSAAQRGAGLGDRALAALVAAGVLRGDQAEVGAQRPGPREAGEVTDLGAEPERAEGVDAGLIVGAPVTAGGQRVDRAIQRVAAREQDVVAVQVVGERRFAGRVVEAQPSQPDAVIASSRAPLVVELAAQQELADPVLGAHQVLAGILATARQIARLLVLDRREVIARVTAFGETCGATDGRES